MTFHVTPSVVHVGDTDCFSVLYQSQVVRRFDEARQLAIGPAELGRLWEEEGLGVLAVDIALKFKAAARLGDELEIRSTFRLEGEYRLWVTQEAIKKDTGQVVAEARVQKVCVDKAGGIRPMPPSVREVVRTYPGHAP